MGKLHHPARLALEVDDVPAANICSLHRGGAPE
jgi:hypothetical protein